MSSRFAQITAHGSKPSGFAVLQHSSDDEPPKPTTTHPSKDKTPASSQTKRNRRQRGRGRGRGIDLTTDLLASTQTKLWTDRNGFKHLDDGRRGHGRRGRGRGRGRGTHRGSGRQSDEATEMFNRLGLLPKPSTTPPPNPSITPDAPGKPRFPTLGSAPIPTPSHTPPHSTTWGTTDTLEVVKQGEIIAEKRAAEQAKIAAARAAQAKLDAELAYLASNHDYAHDEHSHHSHYDDEDDYLDEYHPANDPLYAADAIDDPWE